MNAEPTSHNKKNSDRFDNAVYLDQHTNNNQHLNISSIGQILLNPMVRFAVNQKVYLHSNHRKRIVHRSYTRNNCYLLRVAGDIRKHGYNSNIANHQYASAKDFYDELGAISVKTKWTYAEEMGKSYTPQSTEAPDAMHHVSAHNWGTKNGLFNMQAIHSGASGHGNLLCNVDKITSLSITERMNERVGAYFVRLHGNSLSYPSMPPRDSGLAVINSKNTHQTKKVKVNYIKDKYGTWIKVGMFSNDTHKLTSGKFSIFDEIKKSVKVKYNLSTDIDQETPTAFSADFGELEASEVRILGATDFDRWEETRTIDWVYKVPRLPTNIKLYKEYSIIHKMSGLDKNIRATEYTFDKVDDVFDISVPDLTPLNKVIMDAPTPKLGIFGIEKPDVVRVKISQKLLDTKNSKTNTTWFLGQFENTSSNAGVKSDGWQKGWDAIFAWAKTHEDDTGKPNHVTDWSSDSATVWNLSIKSTQAFDINNPGGEITYNIYNCGNNKSLDKNRNGYTGDDKYHLIKTNNKNLPPNTIEAYIKWTDPRKVNYYLCVGNRWNSFNLTSTDNSLASVGAHEVKWVPESDFSNSDYKNSTINKWLFTVDPDYKQKKYTFNEIDRYMVNRL